MTWSGCTLLNLKEHLLFLMRIVTSVRGFPGLAGKFSLRFLTLFTKYSFIILAKSVGLLYMDPFSTSFVGDPPDDQPSQLLIFFHTELVSFPNDLSFCSCQDFFSFFSELVMLFLSCLKVSQSYSELVSAAFFCARSLSLIFVWLYGYGKQFQFF